MRLEKFNLEVLTHDCDQVPHNLNVHILRELGQTQKDRPQQRRLSLVLDDVEVDRKCFLDNLVIGFRDLSKVQSDSICLFQFRDQLVPHLLVFLELALLP
jgi:hypothetical protein